MENSTGVIEDVVIEVIEELTDKSEEEVSDESEEHVSDELEEHVSDESEEEVSDESEEQVSDESEEQVSDESEYLTVYSDNGQSSECYAELQLVNQQLYRIGQQNDFMIALVVTIAFSVVCYKILNFFIK